MQIRRFINIIYKNVRMLLVYLLILPVKLYKNLISPFLPNSCRFEPTCSEYAIQALKTRGVITGLYLSVRRILRCHPFGGYGYDPVPPPGESIIRIKWSKLLQKARKNTVTILLLFFVSVSCKHDHDKANIISVSIPPQKYLVEKIAGDIYTINVIVPPGASPETYEMSPLQMKKLSDSRIYFLTGHLSFEKAWEKRIEKMNNELIISDLSQGIEMIHTEHFHEDHIHSGIDPHIWISPKTVEIMAKNIYNTLISVDPERKEIYQEGYNDLRKEILQADSILNNLFSNKRNRSFLIFHPALGYLARDYKLEQIPLEYEGKTPPPSYMKKIIDIAKEKNIKAILIQQEFNIENARSLAAEINGEVIQINPLAERWFEELILTGNILNRLFED